MSDFTFTFHFHTLEKEMATHSSVLAWRISGTGESGGLPFMGSHSIGHDWSDLAAAGAAKGLPLLDPEIDIVNICFFMAQCVVRNMIQLESSDFYPACGSPKLLTLWNSLRDESVFAFHTGLILITSDSFLILRWRMAPSVLTDDSEWAWPHQEETSHD